MKTFKELNIAMESLGFPKDTFEFIKGKLLGYSCYSTIYLTIYTNNKLYIINTERSSLKYVTIEYIKECLQNNNLLKYEYKEEQKEDKEDFDIII